MARKTLEERARELGAVTKHYTPRIRAALNNDRLPLPARVREANELKETYRRTYQAKREDILIDMFAELSDLAGQIHVPLPDDVVKRRADHVKTYESKWQNSGGVPADYERFKLQDDVAGMEAAAEFAWTIKDRGAKAAFLAQVEEDRVDRMSEEQVAAAAAYADLSEERAQFNDATAMREKNIEAMYQPVPVPAETTASGAGRR